MRRQKLRIEQSVTAEPQPRHEMDERHLAGVGDPAEHALAKEGGAERDAVEAADQLALVPAFDAMRRAALEQPGIELQNLVVDPGIGPLIAGFGTAAHDRLESGVAADRERVLPHDPAQPARHMERIEGDYAAPFRIDPE